jgi:hypothetical protein
MAGCKLASVKKSFGRSERPCEQMSTLPTSMHYVWLLWSSAFLLPWLFLFIFFPEQRGIMVKISLFTAPFGLTEPVFVPEYWNPPSLFDLAQTTGFDLESIIFCFAIGGVGAVLYNTITGRKPVPVELHEKHSHRHRFHIYAVLSPIAVFLALYFLPWIPSILRSWRCSQVRLQP